MQRDAVGSTVECHVERSRSGRNGVNRAAAGRGRKLNDVGEALTVDADGLVLRLDRTALKLIRHIIYLLLAAARLMLSGVYRLLNLLPSFCSWR